jgi:hypothetical protein
LEEFGDIFFLGDIFLLFYGAVVYKLAEEINQQAVFLCTCGVFNVCKMAY